MILLIDKEKGITSFDVIRKLKPKFPKKTKIGHAGTLDPLASGLMIVAIEREDTKRLTEFLKLPKRYLVEVKFGSTSATYDSEGPFTVVVPEGDLLQSPLPVAVIETAISENFIGEISQRPPDFSAAHVNGVRAYALARRGEKVDLPSRRITIHSCEIVSYEWPKLVLDVRCSSGTYIRSLAHDLGQVLGCGAYVQELRRTEIGEYRIEDAQKIEDVNFSENPA